MKFSSGIALAATGVLHCITGIVIGWAPLAGIVDDGLIGAVADAQRKAMFWFEFGGVMMVLLGALTCTIESRGDAPPRWLGYSLAAVGLVGGLAIPASGFWLVIPQGLWLLSSRAQRLQEPQELQRG